MQLNNSGAKRMHAFLLWAIMLLLLSVNANSRDILNDVMIGQTKEEIEKAIGKPLSVEKIIKSNEYIWGDEESFWSEIPVGTVLLVWHYQFKDGRLNLYFMEESTRLSYKAFEPAGVVYESGE